MDSPPSISSSHHSRMLLLLIGISIILVFIVYLCFFIIIHNISVQKSDAKLLQQSKNKLEEIKKSLLNADNVSFVTLGVALDFIPTEKITNLYGGHGYDQTFFGVKLNSDQLTQIRAAFIPKDNELTLDSQEGYFLDSPAWIAYPLSTSNVFASKDGYICKVPIADFTICSPDKSGCLSPDLIFKCTNISDAKNNTQNNVSKFIYDSLKQIGINCDVNNCPINQSKDNVTIPQFSRSDVYFQQLTPNSDAILTGSVNSDIQRSLKFFKQAGWQTFLQDSTKQEASWSGNIRIIYSQTIQANNSRFSCTHEITAEETAKHVFQKRQLIDCWVNLNHS